MAAIWGRVVFNGRNGVWCVKGNWAGKRVYFSEYRTPWGSQTCKTQREAEQLQLILSSEIANGIFDPKRYRREKPLHVRNYADAWIKSVEPILEHATLKAYRAALIYIKAGLGDVFLPDLAYDRILDWVIEMRKTLALKTIRNYHGVLAKMLHDAKRSGHIQQMPELVEFRDAFSVPVSDPEWLTAGQQQAVLAEIPKGHRYIIGFLFATGVRPSEARALKRADLYPNTEPPYIAIRRTFGPVAGGEAEKPVKQKRERRIPFYQEVVELLREMPVAMHSEYLFVNPATDKPYSKNINRDIWNPACVRALGRLVQLNNAGRHSYANQRLAAGEDIYLVSKRLGHADVRVTQSNYANARSIL